MKLGFKSKIYLGTLSLLLLLGIGISFVVSGIIKQALLEENRNMGITTSANLAAQVAEPMLAMDFFKMKELVDETVQLSNDIFYAFVQNAAGEPLVHTFKKGFPVELKTANTVADNQSYNIRLLDTGNRLIYDYSVPVIIDYNRFGTVRIGLIRTRIQQTINHLIWSAVLSTGFVILIAVFLGTALVRSITRRINILHQSSEQAMSLQSHLSELEQAEKTLKEQRRLLKTVLDSTPDFVCLLNRKLIFQAVNKSFCKMVGRREEEVIGKTGFDLFSTPEAETHRQENLSVIESGKPLIQEVRIADNGDDQWLHVVKIPVHDADGMVVGILCSGRDITEFKKVQEQLT
ncbi:MAG: PAS domain-containing protein, partial [Deltaproteobacteria bacterium]|nr:PAS domain-containing protein [Deltaproteobacteria bacterium]